MRAALECRAAYVCFDKGIETAPVYVGRVAVHFDSQRPGDPEWGVSRGNKRQGLRSQRSRRNSPSDKGTSAVAPHKELAMHNLFSIAAIWKRGILSNEEVGAVQPRLDVPVGVF